MTITITTTRKETKEVKVTLEVPAYYEYGRSYFKILNEKEYIEVDTREPGIRKQSYDNIIGLVADEGRKIEADEFKESYKKAIDQLTSLADNL